MARLTPEQWAELRAEWEASPREGLRWLVRAGGGRWDVSEEAARKRRLAEGWRKQSRGARRPDAAAAWLIAERRRRRLSLAALLHGLTDRRMAAAGASAPDAVDGGLELPASVLEADLDGSVRSRANEQL